MVSFIVHIGSVALFLSTMTACQIFKPNPRQGELLPTYPLLSTIPPPTFDPIEWTRELKIPGVLGAFNPSLVSYGEGFLLIARHDVVPEGGGPFTKFMQSQLVVVQLDRTFAPTGPISRIIYPYDSTHSTAEDPRLFWWKNAVWVIFNARNYQLNSAGPRRMVVGRLQEQQGWFSLKEARFLNYGQGPLEKNWTPFVVDNQLYLIYATDPHRILKVDIASRDCEVVASTSAFPWQRGHLRGGTPALPFGDGEMLTVFHSSKRYHFLNDEWRQIYVMGVYTFSASPPFAITSYTPAVFDSPGLYDRKNYFKIIFPGGLVIEDDSAYVVMGRGDGEILLSKLSLPKVKKSLVPFQGEPINDAQ